MEAVGWLSPDASCRAVYPRFANVAIAIDEKPSRMSEITLETMRGRFGPWCFGDERSL